MGTLRLDSSVWPIGSVEVRFTSGAFPLSGFEICG